MECDCRFIIWLVGLLSFSASLTSCKLLQQHVSTSPTNFVDTDELLLNTTDDLSQRISESQNNCSGLKVIFILFIFDNLRKKLSIFYSFYRFLVETFNQNIQLKHHSFENAALMVKAMK